MTTEQIEEVVGMPRCGRIVQGYLKRFPKLEMEAYVQPLTRSMLQVEVVLKANDNFEWDKKFHGKSEPFWIMVFDCDQEQILHTEQFLLQESSYQEEHSLRFTVPLYEPMPP